MGGFCSLLTVFKLNVLCYHCDPYVPADMDHQADNGQVG